MCSLVALALAIDCARADSDAPGLVCFELSKSAALTSHDGIDPRLVSGMDEAMAGAFEVLRVVNVRPYFRRPERDPATPEEARLSRIFKAEYLSEVSPGDAASLLLRSPAVVAASPVGIRELAGLPDDPLLDEQWGLRQDGDFDMDVPEAWDVGRGDSTVVVAVLDTGLDRTHPDMGGISPATPGNVWVNEREVAGRAGVDDDSNGFVDDIWGWDFVDYRDDSPPPYAGEDATDEDADPSDFYGHGTAVAGIIGALGNNGEGISGMLWRCRVMGIRCGVTLRSGGQKVGVVRMDWCAGAVAYAADMGAAAINASWESGYDPGLEAAVDYAISVGAVVTVAAGNRSRDPDPLETLNYLSSRGDCIDVASVQENGRRRYDSNFGAWVDLSAPGSNILSLRFVAPDLRDYGLWSGTSFAAPAVAAVAAMVKQQNADWTPEQVREHLRATSVPLSPPDTTIGSGVVNAFAAIRAPDGGWSARIGGPPGTNLIPVGDGSGRASIAAGLLDGRAVAFDAAGVPLAGWPIRLGDAPLVGAAAGDCDGDGEPEVVYVDATGAISTVELTGSIASRWNVGAPPIGEPVLDDIDGDGRAEIVICASDSAVHAWDGTGEYLAGWPIRLSAEPVGGLASGDVSGSDGPEVIVACGDSAVHCLSWTGLETLGFPVNAGGRLISPPSLADISGGDEVPEIVIVGADGGLFAWMGDGSIPEGWPIESVEPTGTAGPSLGDIDRDGVDEIALLQGEAPAVYDSRGFLEGGWPSGAAAPGSPLLLADVTGDAIPEVLAADIVGVQAWDISGSPITNWPKPSDGAPTGAIAIGDFDGDNRPEILAVTEDGWLHCWDLEDVDYVRDASPWPLPGRTPGNTRLAKMDRSSEPGPEDPFRVIQLRAVPNPAVSGTAIVSELLGHHDSLRSVELDIFDPAGRLVRSIRPGRRGPGVYRDYWNGRTNDGRRAPPGVYLCVARVDNDAGSCALVLIR